MLLLFRASSFRIWYEMGWLLDPEEKSVVVSPQDGRSRCFEQAEDLLPVPSWAGGLELTVGELFGWLLA